MSDNKRKLIKKIPFTLCFLTVIFSLLMSSTHASTPLWTFTPLTPTTISMTNQESTVVQYNITNQSKKTHTLELVPISGIHQITAPGNCPHPFVLGYQQSCVLSLQINGHILNGNIVGGPAVCQQGNHLQCYQPSLPDVLKISIVKDQAKSLGGTISGLTGTVTLQNNGRDFLTLNTNGSFTFPTPVTQGSPYNVTVLSQPATRTCTVSSGSGIMGSANVTNVTVTCAINSYTVGGTVSGLVGGTVVLQNNGGNDLEIEDNGPFTFSETVAQGSPYNVTVLTQPDNQICSITNGSGTMGGADVTNVTVNCSAITHTVGGTVSGLVGKVILQNNGSDDLEIEDNGAFTFTEPVAQGGNYAVTVLTQPTTQTCSVTNGTGTVGTSDITNVDVTCVTNATTLSVTTGIIPVTPDRSLNGSIVVTNTGSFTAANVQATLPPGWNEVDQDSSDCAIVASGDTCTITFTSTAPYVAQGSISVAGSNTPSPPNTAIAFSIEGYLVYSVDSANTAQVIDTADAPIAPWGNYGTTTATSTTDGMSNTINIVNFPGIGTSAAVNCYNSTNGGAAVGTWYLPSICQMLAATGCTIANINTLAQLGFGGFTSNTNYWTSLQSISNPSQAAFAIYPSPLKVLEIISEMDYKYGHEISAAQ
ncbi:DUF4369 domain-containing protein [Legionella fairfieldensis]|uniref:DUF4369 domain-containing protein n=1 Tax=Legionella fairfieldensis TaxID=45064 RepID=UPI00048E16C8|nr:DUF4369 domain-containing protein [Legionella fairfieldensis]